MRNVIFGLFVLVASLGAFAVACEGGGQQTVQGHVGFVGYVTLEGHFFGIKTRDVGPTTLVIVQDENNERYFLAMRGHDPALKRGQQLEVTFDKGDTVVEEDVTLFIEDEDGKIIDSELVDNVKFKKIISYIIFDNKK